MKHVFLILTSSILFFSTCKKYPEGGFVNQTRKHLFGGNHVGDSKTWKLKLYEVNGIDSTYLIQGANSIPDFYEKFVTFTYNGKDPSPTYSANTFTYEYGGVFDKLEKEITLGYDPNPKDSTQCKIIDNNTYCVRNLLFPEYNQYGKKWVIKKLTKKECVLESTLKLQNIYKIILTQ